MAILDLFSRRQRQARGGYPDVYQYEDLPYAFRVQVVHIMSDVGGPVEDVARDSSIILKATHDHLAREYGVFRLVEKENEPVLGAVNFFLKTTDSERALDVIELFFRFAGNLAANRGSSHPLTGGKVLVEDAIEELNVRFREHGVGYAFESGQVVRIDSQFLHAEAVRPTLHLLAAPLYAGAEAEFLRAHEHFRHQRYTESINEALKAFESVMKVICSKRGWSFSKTDTASRLIEVCLQNGLVPKALLSHFTSLRAALESGVPTVRNRLTGHGQGTDSVTIPENLAAYILHLAAANILLLVKAEQALP